VQVSSVKGKIEKSQGSDAFPCAQQLLIHQGKVLKDETTMADNKVSEGGFLVVMLTKVGLLHCCSDNIWGRSAS
jgi:UV excision repair protein RAD23